MSHGASPVIAAAFGFAILLTAGIAQACPSHTTHTAQGPATDKVVTQDQKVPGDARG